MQDIASKYPVRTIPEQLGTLEYFQRLNSTILGFQLVPLPSLDNDKLKPYLETLKHLINKQLIVVYTVDYGIFHYTTNY